MKNKYYNKTIDLIIQCAKHMRYKDDVIGYLTFVKDYVSMYLKQARLEFKNKR